MKQTDKEGRLCVALKLVVEEGRLHDLFSKLDKDAQLVYQKLIKASLQPDLPKPHIPPKILQAKVAL